MIRASRLLGVLALLGCLGACDKDSGAASTADPASASQAAPPQAENADGQTCPEGKGPGDSWKVDCNTCTCSDEGKTTCTLMACIDELPE